MARAVHLEVRLPQHVIPTAETTDILIKKFLKACSKESIVQYMYENCAYTRRFTKKCVLERQKRAKYRRNAQKHNKEIMSEADDKMKKKKKNINRQ